MNSDSHRNHAGRPWVSKAIAFSLSTTFAGAVAGAVLGEFGRFVPPDLRAALGSVLALLAISIGMAELAGRGPRLLQLNRETPQRWIHYGAIRWAVRNGWTLGIGATSRLGFWLWYVVPLSALLCGRPGFGALLYGAYGLSRGGTALAIVVGRSRRPSERDITLWLLAHNHGARRLAAADLIAVGFAIAIAIGL